PAVFVVGEVVALRARMSWFEARPLFGVRVAVTHTAQRSGLLESRLRELGADVLAFPTLEITPAVPDVLPSDLSTFHWMVLTSVNAANMVFEHLDRSGQDARALAGVKLCAVGATTLDALRRRFLLADAHPEGYSPETLLESLRAQGPLEGQRILLPRSDIARSTLPQVLRAAGADVTEVAAYEKRTPPRSEENLQRLLSFAPHLVVFTNAEAARSFARLLGPTHLQKMSETSAFASIGPVTSQAAREQGLTIAVEPGQHEVEQLIEEICAWHST
ncbi:MAG: uroporphyrinogen-III synthase, partial [Candidatus Hydrogenedentes bacterium]|nr:uroporphyrinogen-III synthase [Candidatus Hydrogenedentota bacterium]